MGLITKEVTIVTNSSNYKHYVDLGYATKCHEKITIPVKALTHASTVRVEIECDNCHNKYTVKYHSYVRHNHDGLTYCNICSNTVLHSRENNPLWNPNKTDEERNQDRTNKEYKLFLNKVLYRDNYTCRCCGTKSTKDNNLIVHHLDGYNWCVEKRTDDTNGITLCECCHSNFHSSYGCGGNTKEQFYEWIGVIDLLLEMYNGELPQARKVYCIEENKVYDSVEDVCKTFRSKDGIGIYDICNETTRLRKNTSINKEYKIQKRTFHNKHFMWYEDYLCKSSEEINNILNENVNPHYSKKIICVTTGELFISIAQASRAYKISSQSLWKTLNGYNKMSVRGTDGKYTSWKYYDEYLEEMRVSA